MGDIRIAPLSGDRLGEALPALARLRIAVFRDFPYLYDGTLDYESKYLSTFAKSRDAVIVAAFDGDDIVGCATGSSLDTHHAQFAAARKDAADLSSTFYCSESVLLPSHRGRGIGHAFFDQREAHARERGYTRSCFCAVVRPENHPLKPKHYSPLDTFWRARGYEKLPGGIARFGWKDIGEAVSTDKPMQFWIRDL